MLNCGVQLVVYYLDIVKAAMRVEELCLLFGRLQSGSDLLLRLSPSISKTLNESVPGWRPNQHIQLGFLEFGGLQALTSLVVYV